MSSRKLKSIDLIILARRQPQIMKTQIPYFLMAYPTHIKMVQILDGHANLLVDVDFGVGAGHCVDCLAFEEVGFFGVEDEVFAGHTLYKTPINSNGHLRIMHQFQIIRLKPTNRRSHLLNIRQSRLLQTHKFRTLVVEYFGHVTFVAALVMDILADFKLGEFGQFCLLYLVD